MGSRQIAYSLFLGVGIAIVALLMIPAVHLPFIVVHGPVSTLDVHRPAWALIFLVETPAFVAAGSASLSTAMRLSQQTNEATFLFRPLRLNSPLRC
jgi:hypothetical protein